ncbi:MAG: hypothetical protein NZ929_06860 [Aigarchaeota archaeon]|nr:hypothetical protein [Aigarchaeota archaeon]MCX8192515.1 hypothetical protein [Nitrososphaeria archaeon]MDW7985749.1 Rpp14/Pop5 family protein [Nitrososphaerota archaeon]
MTRKKKKRYIIVEPSNHITLDSFRKIVERAYLELFGELGFVKAGLRIIKQINNKFILECSNKSVSEVILSISSITDLEGKPITLRVIKIVGTIKKARELVAEE